MQNRRSLLNEFVFVIAWATIFFSENIQQFTGIPAKTLFVVGLSLVAVSGLLYIPSVLAFLRRIKRRE